MMKTFSMILIFSGLLIHCQKNEDNLIDGVKLTGDKNSDLLLFLAASETCNRISSTNKSFLYSGNSFVICGNTEETASFTVPVGGTFNITMKAGIQRLVATGCSTRSFDFYVILYDGTTSLATSTSSTSTSSATLTLSASKTYTIGNDGLVSPSNYSCLGRTPSSGTSDFSITFVKI
jgi:hypothetical protein